MKGMKYYVVYEIWQSGSIIGKGCCEAALKKKITERKDLEDIENLIMENNGIPDGSNVVIVNYILMDEIKYEDEGKRELSVDVGTHLMFLELGYELEREDSDICTYSDAGNEDLYITFNKKHKVIWGSPAYDYFCDVPLLRAINAKVKEMGWLDNGE